MNQEGEPRYKRHEFRFEECHNRRIAKADFDVERATDGELDYMLTVAELWRKSGYNGVRAMGRALFTTIDAERARREWRWNTEMAQFDVIAAENPRESKWVDVDPGTLPKWSEVSVPFPDVPDPDDGVEG